MRRRERKRNCLRFSVLRKTALTEVSFKGDDIFILTGRGTFVIPNLPLWKPFYFTGYVWGGGWELASMPLGEFNKVHRDEKETME